MMSPLSSLTSPPQMTNNPPPPRILTDLQESIRDLSHPVSARVPALPLAPPPTRGTLPIHPTPGPFPSRKGKEMARARLTPPPAAAEDHKYRIPYYDRRLGKAFGNLKTYAKLFLYSYEAGEFRRGAYEVASFTTGHLHLDYSPPTSYRQVASGAGSSGKSKNKVGKPPSPQQVASKVAPKVIKGPPPSQVPKADSLPLASRRPSSRCLNYCSHLPRDRGRHSSLLQLPPPPRFLRHRQPTGRHLPNPH